MLIIIMRISSLGIDVDSHNVMVIGPPLVGKTILVRTILKEKVCEGFGGIYVTTKDTAETVLEWFERFGVSDLMIIDCVSRTIFSDAPDTDTVKRVSIMDLTGISVRINTFLDRFLKAGKRDVAIAFDSVSTVLMYLNAQTVFRFLHVLTNRIKSFGAFAFYTVDENMHDERTVAMLKQLFTGVIEVKEEENRRYLRYISPSLRTEWREFTISGDVLEVSS